MLKKRVEEAVNAQMNAELWSAQFYLSMSLQLSSEGLPGLAAWMRKQQKKALQRASRFIEYGVSQGVKLSVIDIVDIPKEFGNPAEIFEYALVHMMRMTDLIDILMNMSHTENDNATAVMLQDFVSRQVKDESEISQLIVTLKRVGEGAGLVWLDDKLCSEAERD